MKKIECRKCGQCCRNFYLPFTHEQIKKVRKKYKKTGIAELPNGGKPITENTGLWVVKYIKKNPVYGWRCILLTKDNLCPIHDNKPQPCADFGMEGSSMSPYINCPFWRGNPKDWEKDRKGFLQGLKKHG